MAAHDSIAKQADKHRAVIDNRVRALKLIKSGEITVSEAARLAGTTRQRVAYWCADLDPVVAREARLARLWKTTKPR